MKRKNRLILIRLILSAIVVPVIVICISAMFVNNVVLNSGKTPVVFADEILYTSEMSLEEFISGVSVINTEYPVGDDGKISFFDDNEKDEYENTRLIVKATEIPQAPEAIEIFGGYDGYYLIQYENQDDAKAGELMLESQDCVQCVSPDVELELFDVDSSNNSDNNAEAELLADGSNYDYLALDVWSNGIEDPIGISYMNNLILEKYSQNADNMPEVVIAVIDSGVATDHEILQGRLIDGVNIYDSTAGMADGKGHGTMVAGIIADTSLPNVKIMPVRVTNDAGSGLTISRAVAALKAAQDAGADIINMSFGAEGENETLETAVREVQAQGILCVAAAGNAGTDADAYYPANFDSVVTVSNLLNMEEIHSQSNTGSVVDIAAPGKSIVSASINGGTAQGSGTSYAAPFVSAAAAMAYTLTYDSENGQGRNMDDIAHCLYANAVDIGNLGKDEIFGYGRLNFLQFDENPAFIQIEHAEGNYKAFFYDFVYISDEAESSSDVSTNFVDESDNLRLFDTLLCIIQYDQNGKMLDFTAKEQYSTFDVMVVEQNEHAYRAKAVTIAGITLKPGEMWAEVCEKDE